jgi:hypothetical protein
MPNNLMFEFYGSPCMLLGNGEQCYIVRLFGDRGRLCVGYEGELGYSRAY